jgi:hypothetical protein
LNRAILNNKYWYFPVDDVGHEDFMPVGRGVKSSAFCGHWVSFSVCKDVDAHKGVVVGGVDCTGKVVVRHNHLWCHKSSCPVCFIRGWSVREARSIEGRFVSAVERGLGKVEHIMVSVALADRNLLESVMRERSRFALVDRGVVGACMIFHGYRLDRRRGALVWSPHYHCLGFIDGGFDRCRGCVHDRDDCRSCDGFKGREVRGYGKDGYLVKVLNERKTIFGTAHYQLNHATIRVGFKRFQSVTWFGNVSYRKFRGLRVKSEVSCPACHGEMVKSVYVGKRHIAKCVGDAGYLSWFVDEEFDSGEPNYVDVVGGRAG